VEWVTRGVKCCRDGVFARVSFNRRASFDFGAGRLIMLQHMSEDGSQIHQETYCSIDVSISNRLKGRKKHSHLHRVDKPASTLRRDLSPRKHQEAKHQLPASPATQPHFVPPTHT
jgi:hypothetical protein